MTGPRDYWYKSVLEHIPHGEEGSLQCSEEDVATLIKILLKRGYAVCLTGGDIGDDVCVRWVYAGDTEDLNYANYDNVVFTNIDYLEDYPKALGQDTEEE